MQDMDNAAGSSQLHLWCCRYVSTLIRLAQVESVEMAFGTGVVNSELGDSTLQSAGLCSGRAKVTVWVPLS
jgi:hypothetical protein